MKTPDEIKRYQKIISNKEAILNDARVKAEALINEATIHTNELINEHEIMQQAHARAQEVETLARQKAQELVDAAAAEANAMRIAAVQYTDELLANIENLLAHSIQTTRVQYDNMLTSLNQYRDVVLNNRRELRGEEEEDVEDTYVDPQATGEITLM